MCFLESYTLKAEEVFHQQEQCQEISFYILVSGEQVSVPCSDYKSKFSFVIGDRVLKNWNSTKN